MHDSSTAAAAHPPDDQSCGFCRTDLRPGENGTVVASPSFPDAYPANSSCLWLLQTKVRQEEEVFMCKGPYRPAAMTSD